MALTIGQLAAAIRLTDGSDPPEPQLSILTRLAGVADAFNELLISEAPDVVQDECKVRFAAYLYDAPTAGRGDFYGNAWRNCGAASLATRWVQRRAGIEGTAADGTAPTPGGPGVDVTARAAAAAAQLTADQAATAAAAAQTAAAAAQTAADANIGGGDVFDGASLPLGTVVMRMGWSQSQVFDPAVFIRANNHPIDGAAVGTVSGMTPPDFPPALDTDPDLYLHIWIGTMPANVTQLRFFGAGADGLVSDAVAQTLEGVAGTFYVTHSRSSEEFNEYEWSAFVSGDRIASEPWVTAQIAAISSAGGQTAAQVQALIDAAGHLGTAEVNALIDAAGHLGTAEVNALIASAIMGIGTGVGLDAGAVLALIDAAGHQTAAEVQALIDAAALGRTRGDLIVALIISDGNLPDDFAIYGIATRRLHLVIYDLANYTKAKALENGGYLDETYYEWTVTSTIWEGTVGNVFFHFPVGGEPTLPAFGETISCTKRASLRACQRTAWTARC